MNSPVVADRLRRVADQLAGSLGREVTLRDVVAGTFDPATDSVAGPTDTSYCVNAIVSDYRAHEVLGLVKKGDQRVWVPASELPAGVLPDTTWEADYDGKVHTIVMVETDRVGDEAIGYTLTARG